MITTNFEVVLSCFTTMVETIKFRFLTQEVAGGQRKFREKNYNSVKGHGFTSGTPHVQTGISFIHCPIIGDASPEA